MIHVIAIITTKPGKRAEVLTSFHANMPAVHKEDGCIDIGVPDFGSRRHTLTHYNCLGDDERSQVIDGDV